MFRSLIAVVVVSSLVSLGRAEAPKAATKGAAPAAAPAAPPKPAPELTEASKYFLGSWTCDGSQVAGPWGPASKYSGKIGFKTDMGGFFMSVSGEQKTATPPMTVQFAGVNGYDSAAKKFQRFDYDSMGSVMQMSSPGWTKDGKMVFDGEGMMMGQKMKIRHTIGKKTDGEFVSTFEVAGPDGKLGKMADEVCKKAGAPAAAPAKK